MVSRFFNHPQFMLENSAYTSVFWAIFLSYNCYYEKYSDGSVKNIQDEIPFDLPVGWAWSRLKTLSASIQYGVNDSAKTSGSHRLLRITDIQNGSVNWNTVPYTTVNDTKYSLSINDIVFARTGATVGKSFLIKEVPALAVYASYLIRIRLVEPRCANYIYKFFNSSNYWAQITDKSIGVGQPNCNGTSLSQLFIPVPPLNEQVSILTIVENILSLIEHIDVSKCEIEECSRQIKSKILELAIQGKLVPQDENDEPANVLLERIRTERKAKLGKKYVESYIFKGDDNCYYEKIGNTSKKISEEMPFDLPFGWCWITLKEIATITSGKTPKNEQITDLGNIPYFKVGDMNLSGNEIFMEVVQYYVNDCYTGITFPKNSFIFPKNGGALLTNKKRILKQESLVDLNTGVLIPSSAVNNEFMFYLFSTVDFTKNYKGSTIPTIDNEMIGNIVFALPPIEEQSRIVQKIKAIMSILKGGD